MRVAVTGAYGFSGKYMARRLLELRHEVVTLTNSPHRTNPFGESVKAFPYDFAKPEKLERSLRGIEVLINTYWVRFDNPPHFTFAQALTNARILFDAAKCAGVRRIVHISITNPDRKSELPYFRGKAEMEDHIEKTGLSYAILRPAVLFGAEDILINNIAWALRRLPLFGIYGDGRYRLQPIHVDDLAAAAVARITGDRNETTDAIGPETFAYRDMVDDQTRDRLAHIDHHNAGGTRLPGGSRAWMGSRRRDQYARRGEGPDAGAAVRRFAAARRDETQRLGARPSPGNRASLRQ
jgi:uncharacterized protein YbjT (DUF2867 family)